MSLADFTYFLSVLCLSQKNPAISNVFDEEGRISSPQSLKTNGKDKPKGSPIDHDGIVNRDACVAEIGGRSEFCKSAIHEKPQPANSFIAEIER